jgi:DNA primase
MSVWLEAALKDAVELTEEMEGYLLGRGGKPETIQNMELGEWVGLSKPSPDANFSSLFGPKGETLCGMLVCPIWSPRGKVIGFNARSIQQKRIVRFLGAKSGWNPLWEMRKDSARKLWQGSTVWVVEGLFDLFALEWVVPSSDVVLSTIRAAMTRKHIEFLRRFRCRVKMVYDRDETGRRGVRGYTDDTGKKRIGALGALKRVGLDCVDVPYEGGKDPGEIWDKFGKDIRRYFPV